MTFWYKRDFEKACRRFTEEIRQGIAQAVLEVKDWYGTRHASVGLRIKKLYDGPAGKVFEARVSIDLRLVWVEKGDSVWFSIVGSHDEVRRYLRSLR